MWVENGLTGLEGLRIFSKRRNGSSGTVVKFLRLVWEYNLNLINDQDFFLSAVKQVIQREQWPLDWEGLICLVL